MMPFDRRARLGVVRHREAVGFRLIGNGGTAVAAAMDDLHRTAARFAAVHAPRIGEPTIVVDRDIAILEEAVIDAQRIAAAVFARTAGVGDGFMALDA